MDGLLEPTEDFFDPIPRLYERLRQIAGYIWDSPIPPFHSSYDNWHIFGRKIAASDSAGSSKTQTIKTGEDGHASRQRSATPAGVTKGERTRLQELEIAGITGEKPDRNLNVIARISVRALREERAFQICKTLSRTVDPDGKHIVRPLEHFKLQGQQGDKGPIIVSIFENPGPNFLMRYMNFGPAWYEGYTNVDDLPDQSEADSPGAQISLPLFLDFAIGAAECLEILHVNAHVVHGEIRGDSFHMNLDGSLIRLINFGSGIRSFEHGLTSSGWAKLSQETGTKTKLSYISPEQTGRMPAEPDSRTDIYSLGILFWTLLTQKPAFDGESPMDVVQNVLGRRLPSVSSVRLDVPDAIGRIISKMTAKSIAERYHSATGLRHDLVEVQRLLGDGDSQALRHWKAAAKDASSFFLLPNMMIGRTAEHDEIVRVIDKVSKRHSGSQRQPTASLSSESSISDDRATFADVGDLSSEHNSSTDGRRNSVAVTHMSGSLRGSSSFGILGVNSQLYSYDGQNSIRSSINLKPWEKNTAFSTDARGSIEGSSISNEGTRTSSEGVGGLNNQKNSPKFRRKGRCEVITIAGAAGLGKSRLVQSIQVEARRRGYFTSSKFDQAKRTPFGPVLKLLSSLFKQVFSESDTETPFHHLLKQYVRPAWPMLHKVLGLPEFLLGSDLMRSQSRASQLSFYNRSIRADVRRDSASSRSSFYSMALGAQSSQDFLRAGSSTKSTRLMNTFLDVLRVFAQHKFLCFCLDDLQFADDESLELITQLISSKMRMVVIITYRPNEMLPEKIRSIIEPPEMEESFQSGGLGVTRIDLQPLSEDDITSYVAATLSLSKEDILPIAAVIQSKSAGNPFYMREMLDECNRKRCVYYDYQNSQWKFDLDKIFNEFTTEQYHDTLDCDFVTRRLTELPPAARSILAWGSLIGAAFSFEMIQRLLREEAQFDKTDGELIDSSSFSRQDSVQPPYSQQDIVAGLQAAIQAFVIVPTEDDDRFRFAHDRYIQAAGQLSERRTEIFEFIIAVTLEKYYKSRLDLRETTASHICEAARSIRARVKHRQAYRKVLFECAQAAAESGARKTAAKFYSHAFGLLQDDPWGAGEDEYYDESLLLHIRAAECFHYMGEYDNALRLLDIVLRKANTAADKAPAWVLESRVYAQRGQAGAAFQALRRCLKSLGIEIDENPTYTICDAEFERLTLQIQCSGDDVMRGSGEGANDPDLAVIGAVLVECTSAAFWTDRLIFYQMSMVMIEVYLTRGGFPQCAMGFVHLATIAIYRFNMINFANEAGLTALKLADKWRDPYTHGRAGTIYAMFLGHIQDSPSTSIGQLEGALESTIQAGDRVSTILNFGIVAMLKFFASTDISELESFCQFGCEEVPGWGEDCRGGTMLIAIRQVCRSLQGKTHTNVADRVLSDESHETALYLEWVSERLGSASDRPMVMYLSFNMVPLFLYGHYEKTVDIGQQCLGLEECLWSAQVTRIPIFFHGLAIAAVAWKNIHDPRLAVGRSQPNEPQENQTVDALHLNVDVDAILQELKSLRMRLVDWQAVNDINYLAWSKLLDAQIAELQLDHGLTIKSYEEALDHAAANGFIFEEALGNYLIAGFFLRRGSRRPAKFALREATSLFRQLGATGVARHIEDEHEFLLNGPSTNLRIVDKGIQTDFAGEPTNVQYETLDTGDHDQRQPTQVAVTETKGDRIGAWQGASARPQAGAGLPALDMLDLTSILESSQVISSILKIDKLLSSMCEIILSNCGGLASLAAIIVEEDDPAPGWSIVASGDPETGARSHVPGLALTETPMIAESIVLYCTRFRETVFVPDLTRDERFGNVAEDWWHQNPLGKSVIAMPIVHGTKPLLGVLYLEGEPNVFTDRNLTVLQLLVNQIGISYSNALTLKAIEKVSASNVSMVESQKRALAKARDAEAKSRLAEAEAIRNVQLAEEAAKAKSIFLANVSHELRTPLNGVIGNSELLKDSNLRKEQAEMADSIRVSADLLLTVINDILDYSRLEADKMSLFIVAFNADEMLREVIRSVSYSNRDKRSSKDVEIKQDVNLPQTLIYGDPVRLHQVIGNLIGNSLKFTEKGSITIGARMDSETDKHIQLTFWISDTGIGIGPSQLTKLFQPFSQADASTARKYGGSGLGLSICRSLIESMMGGKIELNSEEGVGTTAWFTVTFPRAVSDALAGDTLDGSEQRDPMAKFVEEAGPPSQPSQNDLSYIPRDQLRICVAEDNPINQKIAIQFVQKLGFVYVDAYDNGLAAVEGLRAMAMAGTPYHLVLMDVQMPVLDGYEATKLLRRDPIEAVSGVLVIAMTASAIQGDREKCLEAGMNDYLAKPVRVQILKKKLDQYLQLRSTLIPNLQSQANAVVNDVTNGVANDVAQHVPNDVPSDIADSVPNHESGTVTPTPQTLRNPSKTNNAQLSIVPALPPRSPSRNRARGTGTESLPPKNLARNRSSESTSTDSKVMRSPKFEDEDLSPKSIVVPAMGDFESRLKREEQRSDLKESSARDGVVTIVRG